jgi:hypothetical protein
MPGQTVIWTCRRRNLTSGMPCPIIVADRRFPPRNADRFLYDDKVHRLSPLLSQGGKGGAIGRHVLDGFHNSLDPDIIEVWIQVLDQATAQCPGIRRL